MSAPFHVVGMGAPSIIAFEILLIHAAQTLGSDLNRSLEILSGPGALPSLCPWIALSVSDNEKKILAVGPVQGFMSMDDKSEVDKALAGLKGSLNLIRWVSSSWA